MDNRVPVDAIWVLLLCWKLSMPRQRNEDVILKVAVNTIVPRSPFFLFLYLKTQTVTHIRKNAVEYLRQWNGAICVIYNLCQRQKIR